MLTISLCMIVRNEEEVLGRCLSCVQGIADEIIIVDTGSKDRTREIAASYGAKVFDFEWIDDFAAARNASFDKAEMDYILWLDADDVIDEENRRLLIDLKQTLPPLVDLVMMRYHIAFDENDKPTYTFYRERLVKRDKGYRWIGRVHEAIVPSGHVIQSEIAIRHRKLRTRDPKRNLRIYEKMLRDGETLAPRHRYYFARELLSNERYEEGLKLMAECVEDPDSWTENRIGACRDMASCYLKRGDTENALKALCLSFTLGEPRAEVCCDLGQIYLSKEQYPAAIFWYRAAPECTPSEDGGGFALPECRGYIPCMQLCLCYDRLGQYDTAESYNEKAAALKPGDAAVEQNRAYFSARRAHQAKALP